ASITNRVRKKLENELQSILNGSWTIYVYRVHLKLKEIEMPSTDFNTAETIKKEKSRLTQMLDELDKKAKTSLLPNELTCDHLERRGNLYEAITHDIHQILTIPFSIDEICGAWNAIKIQEYRLIFFLNVNFKIITK
ncbi:hypothetical protein ACJX0J_040618, partial [Zea mays]